MCRSVSVLCVLLLLRTAQAEQRFESFDHDPHWGVYHNRSQHPETVRQDFGYSADTAFAGGARGEVGGTIQPSAEAAYFAIPVTGLSLLSPFSATGKLFVHKGGGHFPLGFFNNSTLNEWRTPNTVAFRIIQRGEVFYCYPEYCSAKWRAASAVIGTYHADTDRFEETELPANAVYPWSLALEPNAESRQGRFVARFGANEVVLPLDPRIKADGVTFSHFGLLPVM